MKKLCIAFAGVCALVFLAPAASAQIGIKTHTNLPSCKNDNAKPLCPEGVSNADCRSWTCVHKTKYYVISACESGYTWSGGKCKSSSYTNVTTPKCKIGNWKDVRKGTDKCYSKKNGQGKYKGNISCSGLNSKDMIVDQGTGLEDKCGKKKADKNRKKTNCGAGWKKGEAVRGYKGSNGAEKFYCNTIGVN